FFFFQAADGIRVFHVTGVQTCALPISPSYSGSASFSASAGRLPPLSGRFSFAPIPTAEVISRNRASSLPYGVFSGILPAISFGLTPERRNHRSNSTDIPSFAGVSLSEGLGRLCRSRHEQPYRGAL